VTSVRDLTRTPAMRVAFVAVVVAAATLVWQIVRAIRPDQVPDVPATMVASLNTVARTPARPPADIEAAVENDLFAADRSAPSVAYRMPGESRDDKPVVVPMKPTMLGTITGSDGRNFATLQLGDSSPKLVTVGDKIGEWVVKGISRGKVVLLSNAGARAELTANNPGT